MEEITNQIMFWCAIALMGSGLMTFAGFVAYDENGVTKIVTQASATTFVVIAIIFVVVVIIHKIV